MIKRVYVFNCTYEIRKIEYFDAAGQISSVAQLDNYIEVEGSNGWRIPSEMRFDTGRWDLNAQSLTATITSAKKIDFKDRQRKLFFTRPAPEGFEHVEKIGPDCRAIEY
jgi:hypothetical protein